MCGTIEGQSFTLKKLFKGKGFHVSKPEEVQILLANSLNIDKSTISMEKNMIIALKMHILFSSLATPLDIHH